MKQIVPPTAGLALSLVLILGLGTGFAHFETRNTTGYMQVARFEVGKSLTPIVGHGLHGVPR